MYRLEQMHLSVLLLVVAAGSLMALISCQSFVRPVTTGDIIDYTEAAAGFGFPQAQPQLLRYRDTQDVAAMRRHGWEIWVAMTQPTAIAFPIFLTWYQVSDVFGQEPGRNRSLFAPEFRVPSQKTLGDGDTILSFKVYNAPLLWDDMPTRPIEWGRGVQDLIKRGFFNRLSPQQQAELAMRFWKRPFRLGDYVAFVAAHVTTREIPDGVWATFWWHDAPDAAPFGSDRPKAISGVFRNYLMRVAYHGDTPREPNGSPHVAFNPHLEAAFSYGPKSNCLACHQRALIGSEGPGPVFPVMRGQLSKQASLFAGKVRLDFLWSLAFETK